MADVLSLLFEHYCHLTDMADDLPESGEDHLWYAALWRFVIL